MSLPLENPATHETLHASRPPEIWYVDESDVQTQPSALRVNRAHHTLLADLDTMPELLRDASRNADAASKELRRREADVRSQMTADQRAATHSRKRLVQETERAQHHLWALLDPSLGDKSAAVKTIVQRRYFDTLFYGLGPGHPPPTIQPKDDLAEWTRLAVVVAKGMSTLFAHGTDGWDVGLVRKHEHEPGGTEGGAQGTPWVVERDANGDPVVPLEAWRPFVHYDRTAANPAYAGCFQDESQRMRSGICTDRASEDVLAAWKDAQEAHWRMLQLEAATGLFDPSNPFRQDDGMDAHFLGGLFLLTSVSDNWPKRTALFGLTFWLLKVWHFALVRNTGLKMAPFSTDHLVGRPRGGRRQTRPDPQRSYCWLDNALQVMVSLKVMIFYRVRHHAYDHFFRRPRVAESELTKRFRIDRHDVEQSINHWLPASRDSAGASSEESKPTTPVLGPTSETSTPESMSPLRLDDERLLGPPARAPATAFSVATGGSAGKPAARIDALAETLAKQHRAATLSLVHAEYARDRIDNAVAHMSLYRDALRRCTATYAHYWMAVRRTEQTLVEAARARYLEHLATAASSDTSDTSETDAEIRELFRRFQCSNTLHEAQEQVRTRVVDEGLFCGPTVPRLCVSSSKEEWARLFGERTPLLSGTSCAPDTGLAEREARSYDARLAVLAEAKRRADAVDAHVLVALPVEATAVYMPSVSPEQLRNERPLPAPSAPCPSIQSYQQHRERVAQDDRRFAAVVGACEQAMARCLRGALLECLAHAARSRETEPPLRLPHHVHGDRDGVVSDVLHRVLVLAHQNGLLSVVADLDYAGDDDDPARGACMVEWDHRRGTIRLGDPCRYLRSHWPVFVAVLQACLRAEPCLRGRLRRSAPGLLREDERRRVRVTSDTRDPPLLPERTDPCYPTDWPPDHTTDLLADPALVRTMLLWSWPHALEFFSHTNTTPSAKPEPARHYPYNTTTNVEPTRCAYPLSDLKILHCFMTATLVPMSAGHTCEAVGPTNVVSRRVS